MSRVKPILFNTDMVRATLNGRMTVTRRLIKPQPKMQLSYICMGHNHGKWSYPPQNCVEQSGWDEKYRRIEGLTAEDEIMRWTPPCHTGDVLWVKETWGIYCENWTEADYFMYRADYPDGMVTYEFDGHTCDLPKWRPSIHMPKEVARIWLKVTDVSVERLQNITEDEAIAEGCIDTRGFIQSPENEYRKPQHTAREQFMETWDYANKKKNLSLYGWVTNPWVWIIEFERCEKPREV